MQLFTTCVQFVRSSARHRCLWLQARLMRLLSCSLVPLPDNVPDELAAASLLKGEDLNIRSSLLFLALAPLNESFRPPENLMKRA
jgi:hypothetical protein